LDDVDICPVKTKNNLHHLSPKVFLEQVEEENQWATTANMGFQINLCQLEPSVKNYRVLLEQIFTAHMPLVTKLAHLDFEEEVRVVLYCVILYRCHICAVTVQ